MWALMWASLLFFFDFLFLIFLISFPLFDGSDHFCLSIFRGRLGSGRILVANSEKKKKKKRKKRSFSESSIIVPKKGIVVICNSGKGFSRCSCIIREGLKVSYGR